MNFLQAFFWAHFSQFLKPAFFLSIEPTFECTSRRGTAYNSELAKYSRPKFSIAFVLPISWFGIRNLALILGNDGYELIGYVGSNDLLHSGLFIEINGLTGFAVASPLS